MTGNGPHRPSSSGRPAGGGSGGRAAGERPPGGRPSSGGQGRPPASGAPSGRRAEIEQRAYDPRREQRRQAARVPLPDDVDARELDRDARAELRPLARETADLVARHLVVAGRLLEDEPESALAHARAARALAGRVAAVREAAGLAAYRAGGWAEALAELRTARRISGDASHLAVMADCERALGRPERALAYAEDDDADTLEQTAKVELIIVLAGARRDLGQLDAALVQLQEPARRTKPGRPWAARLWYAYADTLLAAGREAEAREWFGAAADVDADGQTDAEERLLELDGIVFEDLQGGELQGEEQDAGDDAPAASTDL